MIYANVVPYLSSGLAIKNKIISMFVLFSRLFGHFESLAFFNMGGQTLHQSRVLLSKVQQLSNNFLKSAAILIKK